MKSKYVFAVKFFTETKNEEQLNISYKEIENFLDVFTEFIFYYEICNKDIEEELINLLPEEIKYYNKIK